MRVLGIDPGKDGYMVLRSPEEMSVEPMPYTGKEFDVQRFAKTLNGLCPDVVYVEKLQAMGKMGAMSSFTMGSSYGALIATVQVLGFRLVLVRPQEWKKFILVGTSKDKEAAINYVRRSLPNIDLTPGKKVKPSDGIADAACIAMYGTYRENGIK